MAKKAMGKVQKGGKDQTKCIKMVRSSKTNGYYFKEEIVSNDKVQDFFQKEKKEDKEGGQ